jgi:hypothetical protein
MTIIHDSLIVCGHGMVARRHIQADDLQVSESDSEDYEKSEHEANMSSVVLKHVSKNASLAALAVACRSLCSPCPGNQCLECNTTMPTRPCVSVCYNYYTFTNVYFELWYVHHCTPI